MSVYETRKKEIIVGECRYFDYNVTCLDFGEEVGKVRTVLCFRRFLFNHYKRKKS
jgi:hypothetical protein